MTRASGARAARDVIAVSRTIAVTLAVVGGGVGCGSSVERATEAPLHVASFAWVAQGDSARAPLAAGDDSTEVAAVVRVHVDDRGALRRYVYAPISTSGDWVDELTISFDADGRAGAAERRASTFYTTCQPVVHVEEQFAPAGDSLVRTRRVVRDTSAAILTDTTCADGVAPLGSLPRRVDSLVARKLIPRNWRSLVEQSRTAPRDTSHAKRP